MSAPKKFTDNPEQCTSEEDKRTFQNLSKVLKKLKTCARVTREEGGDVGEEMSEEMRDLIQRIEKMDKASEPVASAKSIKKQARINLFEIAKSDDIMSKIKDDPKLKEVYPNYETDIQKMIKKDWSINTTLQNQLKFDVDGTTLRDENKPGDGGEGASLDIYLRSSQIEEDLTKLKKIKPLNNEWGHGDTANTEFWTLLTAFYAYNIKSGQRGNKNDNGYTFPIKAGEAYSLSKNAFGANTNTQTFAKVPYVISTIYLFLSYLAHGDNATSIARAIHKYKKQLINTGKKRDETLNSIAGRPATETVADADNDEAKCEAFDQLPEGQFLKFLTKNFVTINDPADVCNKKIGGSNRKSRRGGSKRKRHSKKRTKKIKYRLIKKNRRSRKNKITKHKKHKKYTRHN